MRRADAHRCAYRQTALPAKVTVMQVRLAREGRWVWRTRAVSPQATRKHCPR